jgi:hypothetical protein
MSGTALARQRVITIKPRTYLHLDPPLSEKRRAEFSVTPEQVEKHSFLPFVGFEQIERRIDFDSDPFWTITDKSRPIRYASHNDSAIHSYYCDELSQAYEDHLISLDLSGCVLAYRSGTGSNITFAKDLFEEVRARGACVVACYDVTKFFDSLQHERLERAILNVLKRTCLTRDWIAIFKRITRYEWVDSRQLRKAVGKSSQPHRLCSIQQFREKVRPLIERNDTGFGIPQGSPLSGLLANVYMLSFDARMRTSVAQLGGSYRRYSDDIAIVLPNSDGLADVKMALNVMLSEECLRLNDKKTAVTRLCIAGPSQICEGDTLQYLGFTYDGDRILLRPSSLARFYKKMKAAIRITVRAAYHAGYPEGEIRRRTLVGRFTHWGDRKNFVQYAYRASRILNSPDIRRQLRNHVDIFQSTLEKYRDRYYNNGGKHTAN